MANSKGPRTLRPWVKLSEWRLSPGEGSGLYATLYVDAETKETAIDIRFWRGRPGRALNRSWAGVFVDEEQQSRLEEAFTQSKRLRAELEHKNKAEPTRNRA